MLLSLVYHFQNLLYILQQQFEICICALKTKRLASETNA